MVSDAPFPIGGAGSTVGTVGVLAPGSVRLGFGLILVCARREPGIGLRPREPLRGPRPCERIGRWLPALLIGGGVRFIELGFGFVARSTFCSGNGIESCLLVCALDFACCNARGDFLVVGSLDPSNSVGIVGGVVVDRGLGLTAVDSDDLEDTNPFPGAAPTVL